MSASTKIEWTDATWNPVGGCSIHSPGCQNCYAMRLAARHPHHPIYEGTVQPSKAGPVWTGKLTIAPDEHPVWKWPTRWRGSTSPVMGDGKPSLIFVGDMSDLFHEDRPFIHVDRVFGTMGNCEEKHSHIFQLLTKRPNVMAEYIAMRGYRAWNAARLGQEAWPARNVWLGCSVERQQEADERRPYVAQLAARGFTTFVSYEPALGAVDWTGWEFVKQIISGGESDRNDDRARPSRPDWHRVTGEFCAANGIAFFFKQWGEYLPVGQILPGHGKICGGTAVKPGRMKLHYIEASNREPKYAFAERGVEFASTDDNRLSFRVGKLAAGRLLDGREHNGFPEVRA
jgi:protein gp37